MTSKDDGAKQMFTAMQEDLTEAIDTLRDLARGIYPPLLAEQGLHAALDAQARRAAIPVEVDADGIGRYPAEIEATAYFCALEALQNIAKYAQATRARISLREDDGTLRFTVEDDGAGFDLATTPRGSGLQNMRDRLSARDGILHIDTAPGAGTRVIAELPVPT